MTTFLPLLAEAATAVATTGGLSGNVTFGLAGAGAACDAGAGGAACGEGMCRVRSEMPVREPGDIVMLFGLRDASAFDIGLSFDRGGGATRSAGSEVVRRRMLAPIAACARAAACAISGLY